MQIWMNPPGFIKAAQANNATVTMQGGNKIVAFTTASGQKFTGVINGQNLVEKITTSMDNTVLGDMVVAPLLVDASPGRLDQRRPNLDLSIDKVPICLRGTRDNVHGEAVEPFLHVRPAQYSGGLFMQF